MRRTGSNLGRRDIGRDWRCVRDWWRYVHRRWWAWLAIGGPDYRARKPQEQQRSDPTSVAAEMRVFAVRLTVIAPWAISQCVGAQSGNK